MGHEGQVVGFYAGAVVLALLSPTIAGAVDEPEGLHVTAAAPAGDGSLNPAAAESIRTG